MSGAGGSRKDFGSQLLDVATNIVSLGAAGYKDGGFGVGADYGAGLHFLDETVGEVTGRNKSREALAMQAAAIEEEKQQRSIDEQNRQLQLFRQDVAASRSAQALRASADARNRRVPSITTTDKLGEDEKDILGL